MGNLLYLLRDQETGHVAIIDPAWDPNALVAAARQLGTPSLILLTHTHPDHVNALPEVQRELNLPVYVSHDTSIWRTCPSTVNRLREGDTVMLGATEITVWELPGHSPCGLGFIMSDRAILGDTIFVFGCGHCRLPGSNAGILYDSLCRLGNDLPPDLPLHTGHLYGPHAATTIKEQLAGNPYLHCDSKEAFCELRNKRPGRTTPFKPVSGIPEEGSPDW